MKTLKKLLLSAAAALTVLSAPDANASSYGVGNITSYYVLTTGLIVFYLYPAATGMPSCATTQRFAFDPTTTAGKIQYASFQSAFLSNKVITVWGGSTCSLWSDSETMGNFVVTY